MALTLASFSKPDLFAFHLTERVNMARIERLSLLESAERLYRAAGEDLAELRRPRRGPKSLVLGGETIHLRDQDPLNLARLNVSPWTDPGEWCLHMNGHVFFWPGKRDRPIKAGLSHFKRYQGSDVVIVRVPMGELVRLNADRLRLCAVNSGQTGARMKMVPRGPDTYAPLERFAGTRRDVKELVFHDHAALPASRALLDIDLVLSSAG